MKIRGWQANHRPSVLGGYPSSKVNLKFYVTQKRVLTIFGTWIDIITFKMIVFKYKRLTIWLLKLRSYRITRNKLVLSPSNLPI